MIKFVLLFLLFVAPGYAMENMKYTTKYESKFGYNVELYSDEEIFSNITDDGIARFSNFGMIKVKLNGEDRGFYKSAVYFFSDNCGVQNRLENETVLIFGEKPLKDHNKQVFSMLLRYKNIPGGCIKNFTMKGFAVVIDGVSESTLYEGTLKTTAKGIKDKIVIVSGYNAYIEVDGTRYVFSPNVCLEETIEDENIGE